MCEMFAILDGTVYQRFKEKNKRDVIKKCLWRIGFFERRLGLRRRDREGRANEVEGRRGRRWRVKKGTSGGRWDLLRAYKRRSWVGVGHTARQGFHAHCPV
jgi:hypothetical protein